MKTFYFLALMALALGFTLSACKKDEKDVSSVLQTNIASLTLPATGGKDTVSITSNTSWRLTGLPAWLTATPPGGEW